MTINSEKALRRYCKDRIDELSKQNAELLEALEACRMHIETLERMHDHELPEGEMLRAAIAKAKGGDDV